MSFDPDSFEDKIARILVGDFTSISGNNSVASKSARGTPGNTSPRFSQSDDPANAVTQSRGIAAVQSFISDVKPDSTVVSHSTQNLELSRSIDGDHEDEGGEYLESPEKGFDPQSLRPDDEFTNMVINDDERETVNSSPTLSETTPIMEELERQSDSGFPSRQPSRSIDSKELPKESPSLSKGGKLINPKVSKLDANEESFDAGPLSIQVESEAALQPIASPNSLKGGGKIVKPTQAKSGSTTPLTEVTPVRKRASSRASDVSQSSTKNPPIPSSSQPVPAAKKSATKATKPSSNPPQAQNQARSSTSTPSVAQSITQQSAHTVESPTRYSTPSKLFSSPNSATSSVGVGERSIVVAVRVRPFNQSEKSQKARRTISTAGEDLVIVNPKAFDAEPDTVLAAAVALDHNPWAHAFRFDQCLWSYDHATSTSAFIDQVGVHEALGYDIVDQALNGISCSCFAYGHTSTGKTYSLFGKLPQVTKSKANNSSNYNIRKSLDSVTLTEDSGLVPRVFHDVITAIKTNQVSTTNSRIFMSFLEIYNEKVVDLLADTIPSKVALQANGEWLKVREHPSYGPYVENLRKVEIFTVEDMFALLAKGNENRSTAQTIWNNESSRSHAVVTLELASFDVNGAMKAIEASISTTTVRKDDKRHSAGAPGGGNTNSAAKSAIKYSLENSHQKNLQDQRDFDHYKTVRIQMIDLAGSEKEVLKEEDNQKVWSGMNYHDTTPNKQLEAVMDKEKTELKLIRRSLATLGYIIQSLSRGASFRSLPYRDSKLTFLLRDALKGSNHTTMLATISPAHIHYDETLATLRYAEKLCALGRKVTVNATTTSIALPLRDDRPQMIEEFRRYHSDLELTRKSNLSQSAAKQLLQFTISDPQQRIAKITRDVEYSTGKSNHKKTVNNADLTFTSPIDGKMKKVRDLTSDDLDTLQSTYRNIQSQVIELQIDLDAVKTDRDTLLLEVKGYKEKIQEIEIERSENNQKITNYIKSLKLAEKEVMESRTLLRRKEEHIERLIQELNESKQGRINAEQAYHARTKEFLVRFDNLKK